MTKEEKVVFLKNPNDVLEQVIKNFIHEAQPNQRTQLDDGTYWEEPLVGFASGIAPLFFEYKTLIGSFHLTPREIISAALHERGRSLLFTEIEQISVISWALPASEDIRKSNRQEKQFPSKLWAYTRAFGEACNVALKKQVVTFLEDLGHPAVAPTLSPTFQYLRDEKVGWASPWSERHIAYACGLGTFSLNDGLITPKGMAVRFGSVVTLLKLTPSEKKYRHYRENCLQFRNEKCGKCIPRCPAGAISEKGHDKDKCKEYVDSEVLQKKRIEYGLENPPPACGLCQTDVPCEFQIPRPDLIA
ncbi:MAG TPA: epoxyqueuosine reductase [Thermodesulfobacteriota bacterium]|nr:epoxyqueuosine reductase [Thermodesulfobacteriota bacterium]